MQLDSINIVHRAHHLTLSSRLDEYRADHLTSLFDDRSLFEHWTHCASAIPTKWFPYWKRRFERNRKNYYANFVRAGYLGDKPRAAVGQVRKRIEMEGPLGTKDFQGESRPGRWWGWKPNKAALELLWATGELMSTRTPTFQKIYDLTERVIPKRYDIDPPSHQETIEWSCRSAVERLIVSTPWEIADFWRLVSADEAKRWCEKAADDGYLLPVTTTDARSEKPKLGYALADWEKRLENLPEPPNRLRLLSPFEPGKLRFTRLFNFEHFLGDIFKPKAKRRYGYYVMPLLEGDRLVGRVDPKFHRDKGLLEIFRIDWQPGVRTTKKRLRDLETATSRLAGFIGAEGIKLPASKAH